MTSVRSRVLVCLAFLPLLLGVGLVGAGFTIERSWGGAPDATDAAFTEPGESGAAGTNSADTAGGRAASDAGAHAGMLKTGTGQLVSGTGELKKGAGALGDGVRQAQSGAGELAEGMRQLQAGTGELGAGAEELANTVGSAVDKLIALGAVQGQVVEAADQLDDQLKESTDPRAATLREELTNFRRQVEAADIPSEIGAQLTRLKEGSRELATQLESPGAEYHDGIFAATNGARQLKDGLDQLADGVDEAVAGVGQLDEGARRIDRMAAQNREKLGALQGAVAAAPGGGTTQAGDGTEPLGAAGSAGAFSLPVYAFMFSALAGLGGVTGALAWRRRQSDGWLLGGTAVAATGVLLWLTAGATPLASAAGVAALVLGGAAAAVLTLVMLESGRSRWAVPVVAMLGLVQLAGVGAVWRAAAVSMPHLAWQMLAGLSPLNWSSVAIAGVVSGAPVAPGLVGCVLLAAIVVVGTLALRCGAPVAVGKQESGPE